MPKSFLLKRRSVNGMVKLTAKPSDKQAEKGVAEGMNASSKPDQKVQEVMQYGLHTGPRSPSVTSQVDAQDRNIFSTRETSFNKDFSHLYIYNPVYHFPVPDALRSVYEKDTAVFNNMHACFSYLHTTSSEHFESWRSNAIGYLPVVSYDVFKGENLLASPSKILIPEEVREPYRCDQCGKIFKTKYTLAIHLKMPNHTFARPFVCNTCGKGFRLSSTLCRHKIIHTKDKPYKCHLCEKAFNRSSTLKTHVRTHSLEKEFVCERCGKGFHQKGNLRNHILIHTGEKPYKCTLCHKAFNKLSNLKFHMHVHTDNSPYKCSFCKVSFSRRCDLKSHVHTTHYQNESEILKNKTKVNPTC